MSKIVNIISLGCSKNRVDSEIMIGKLGELNFEFTTSPSYADIIIINTCAFIKEAVKESKEIIKKIKKKEDQKLIICGCLPQLEKTKLLNEFPKIDAIVGSGEFYKIEKIIEKLYREEKKIAKISPVPSFIHTSKFVRGITTPLSYAYLKIAEGCSNMCSYCRIPFLRGKYRSREIEDVLEEAKKLTKIGVKELIVIAQDTTSFGMDRGEYLLPKLLEELNKLEELEWIRLLYTHPAHFKDSLISVIKESKKVCKYIDIPIQHTDEKILRKMNRPPWNYTKEVLIKIKEEIENIVLRTTIIVGFPGEGEKEFEGLLKEIEEIKFDWLGGFIYSPEIETLASRLKDKTNYQVKVKRLEKVMKLQEKITKQKNTQRIGKKVKVLVDKEYKGHTEFQLPELDGKVIFLKKKKIGEVFWGKVKRMVNAYDLEL
jgi:ribosomal protein S12 methylthiotransferase